MTATADAPAVRRPRGLPAYRARHRLAEFVARRVLAGVATLLVVSFLIFLVMQVLPGNVAETVLGRTATPERVAALEADLSLNDPVAQRYVRFVGDIVTGDLGNSSAALAQGVDRPVWDQIRLPLRNSLVLALLTLIVFVPLCLVLGTVAALRANRATDNVVSSAALVLGAMPEFLIGTLLILVFFTQLDLLPPVSDIPSGANPLSSPDALVLPVLTLLGVSTAFGTRLLRASMIEILGQDFVAMARLNGYRERRVIVRYALRNAVAPSVQVLAQQAQYLIGGIIVVENVFNYPGIGNVLVQAISVRDTQVVMVVALLLAAIYVAVNIIADLVVVIVVPKLRTQA